MVLIQGINILSINLKKLFKPFFLKKQLYCPSCKDDDKAAVVVDYYISFNDVYSTKQIDYLRNVDAKGLVYYSSWASPNIISSEELIHKLFTQEYNTVKLEYYCDNLFYARCEYQYTLRVERDGIYLKHCQEALTLPDGQSINRNYFIGGKMIPTNESILVNGKSIKINYPSFNLHKPKKIQEYLNKLNLIT